MKSLRVALAVQKCIPGALEQNLTATRNAITQAAAEKADMILFPEMNLTGYMADPKIRSIAISRHSPILQTLSEDADRFGMCILAGLAEQTETHHIYASHLVFSPCRPGQGYRKIHRAPNEKTYFSSGNTIPVFEYKGMVFGIQLCYDAHFPELSTAMALKGADIIFIPHASPRGSSREKFQSWMRHLTARAFDNGVFVVAVNQTGDNSRGLIFPGLALVIGPDGNIASKFIDARETIHLVDMDLTALDRVRSHRMRYFLPHRRPDLFGP